MRSYLFYSQAGKQLALRLADTEINFRQFRFTICLFITFGWLCIIIIIIIILEWVLMLKGFAKVKWTTSIFC